MINNREAKRFNLKFGKYLDPIGLFLLIAVFILPALAVVNLSPKSKTVHNVLGAQSKKEISVVLVGGVHDYLKEENISFPSATQSNYEAKLLKRNNGEYSKPILQFSNSYEKEGYVDITGGSENPTGSPISVIFNQKEYLVQDSSGATNVVRVTVPKMSKDVMYLKFDTNTPIKFNEKVSLSITQK